MRKSCGNCAYDADIKSEMCDTCEITRVGKEPWSEPSNWKALPMTNADRIRSMTDEELADWLSGGALHSNSACDYCKFNKEKTCTGKECQGVTDRQIITAWLKQPVEVE